MKTTKLALTALFFAILLPVSFAHASANPYAEAYAVGSNGSTIAQSDFTLSQVPFIYVQFFNAPPAGALDNEITLSTWTNPNNVNYSPNVAASTSNQLWISFTPSQWDNIKVTGTWQTSESSSGTAGPFSELASFKVNAAPEPVGTVLFLTGGLIMAISILRRKKAMAV